MSRFVDTPLPAIFTGIFVLIAVALGFSSRVGWPVLLAYLLLSGAVFAMYAWDKAAARRGSRRTPETTLLLLGLIGGWPGAYAAQRMLRHKSAKQSFQLAFWATALLNVVGFAYFSWTGELARVG